MEKWVEDVRNERGKDAIIILVGNKIDLGRQVRKEQVEQKAKEFEIVYTEVCAKTGDNVRQMFLDIAKRFPAPESDGMDISAAGMNSNFRVDNPNIMSEKQSCSC